MIENESTEPTSSEQPVESTSSEPPAAVVVPQVPAIVVPHGEAEVRAAYGDIKVKSTPGGLVIYAPPGWEDRNMVILKKGEIPGLPDLRVYMHKKVRAPFIAALEQWQRTCPEYPIHKIGCFNVRMKRTATGELSMHSWAVAFDVNPDQNPLSTHEVDGAWVLHTDMPDVFVKCWTDQGFVWGGNFKGKKDPMHFQLASGV